MKKKGIAQTSRSVLHSIDMFSLDVNFRENSKSSYTTCFGSLVSLFIFIIGGFYLYIKLYVVINYQDTKFQEVELFKELP